MKRYRLAIAVLFLTGFLLPTASLMTVHAQTPLPVVHAVLFYSPSCPHCHQVITEDLPPLFEKYGSQLDMIGVDITQEAGQALYQAAIQLFNIPEERQGVPTLIVGDGVLVGSIEIPEQFPSLIEAYLGQGGVDWPDILDLRQAMAQSAPPESPSPQPAQPTESPAVSEPAPGENGTVDFALNSILAPDPVGIASALIVLIGMFLAVLWSVFSLFRHAPNPSHNRLWIRIIIMLCFIGLGVAGYLTYIETLQVPALCGPIGDCNAVQLSEYARLFGFLPVALLGMIFYTLVLFISILWQNASHQSQLKINAVIICMALLGTLFSIYLTYLEVFVLRAVCSWCLSSAIVSALLLLSSVSMAPKSFRYTIREKFKERFQNP